LILGKNAALAILILALIALIIIFWQRRRRKQGTYRLTKDFTGLWRYHSDTEFERKVAYENQLSKSKSRKERKAEKKAAAGSSDKGIAVLTFDGDVRAKQHKGFAKLVDEVLLNREELCEVVVVITSPGGMVSQYGHVYAEMERIRNTGVSLTVCIDVVAASGGYLMSLPANKIIAAPFSVVGSVGVVAFVPNIRNFLTDHNIQPRTFTSGKYKRTVTLTDDASPDEVARFQSQLETIHRLFLDAVKKYRPAAKMEEVETGQYWSAQESLELGLGLVDEIATSHDYLLQRNKTHDLVLVSHRRNFWDEKLGKFGVALWEGVERRVVNYLG